MRIILSDKLEPWQACNVSAFLGSGVLPEWKGQKYQDKSGANYVPLVTEPIFVHTANDTHMKRTIKRGHNRDVHVGIFTFDMFDTSNDEDNRKTVSNKETKDLDAAGLIVFGTNKEVNRVIRGLPLYK